MKKMLLVTVAAIPLLAVGTLPSTAQDTNRQRGQAGASQSQGQAGAQERRSPAQGMQQGGQQGRTSGQAGGGSNRMSQGAQQGRTEGRAGAGTDQTRGQGSRQSQDQARSRQDQQRTTGEAIRQGENAGTRNQPNAEQNRTRGAQNQNQQRQNQRQSRGAQNQPQNQRQPAQTTGQSHRPENERTQNQRTQQNEQTQRTQQNQRTEQNQPNQRGSQNAQGENRGANQARGRVTLNDEQRSRIQRDVLSGRDVPRVDRVDFSLDTGTVVPERVRVREVPSVLVDIYPEWRDDEYFVANDEIVVLDRSRHIVAMVPVGSSSASVETRSSTVGLAGNADIREVQQVLIDKGFYHGRIDGVMGRETMDALMQFQRREGLEATGRIDERTTAALGISGQGRGATDGRGDQGQGRGATEGRGDQGQGRFEQRQGKPEPNRAGQTSGQGRNRDLNGRQENQSRTGAQDRRNQPGQGEPPSTSGQGGTQGRGQSARPQNQTAPNGSGGNEQRRRPGER